MARIATALLVALLALPAVANAVTFPSPPAPQQVPSDAQGFAFPDVQVGPTGEAVAAWREDAGASVDTAIRPPGGSWIAEPLLVPTSGGGSPPALFLDGDRTVMVVSQDGMLRIASRAPGGAWSPVQAIASLAQGGRDVAVHDGRIAAGWIDDPNDRGMIEVYGTHAAIGGTAIAPDLITTMSDLGAVAAAIDGTGRAVVVWQDVGGDDIDYATSGAGDTTFGAPADVDANIGSPGPPVLATDGAGDVHLTYYRGGANDWEIVYRRMASGAAGFGPAELVAEFDTPMPPTTEPLVASPDGTVTTFTRLSELRAHTRPPGGSFPDPAPAVLTDDPGGFNRSASVSPGGIVSVVFGTGSSSDQLVAVRRPGQPWIAPQPIATSDTANEASVSIGPTGDAAAVWDLFDTGAVEATIGDSGTPPALTFTAPAALSLNQAGAFGLTATDFSGIASSGFDFGDGTSTTGTSASHAYGSAGAKTATARATDGLGFTSTQTASVNVVGPLIIADPPGQQPPRRRTRQPDANINRIRSPIRARSLRQFGGTASDELGLRGVEIALVRLSGGARFTASTAARRCFSLRGNGRVRRTTIRRGRCRPTTFLRATGTTRWRYRLRRRLPRGSYVLVARARAADGTVERGFSAGDRNLVRFRVR